MSSRISISLSFSAIVLLMVISGPFLAASPVDPHNFLSYGMDCENCHRTVRGVMQKPVGEICAGCHNDFEHSHPVDLKPALDVPADMPLDARGLMTCSTCHNPHMVRIDPVTSTRTMYLRHDSSSRLTFCRACHAQIYQTRPPAEIQYASF